MALVALIVTQIPSRKTVTTQVRQTASITNAKAVIVTSMISPQQYGSYWIPDCLHTSSSINGSSSPFPRSPTLLGLTH